MKLTFQRVGVLSSIFWCLYITSVGNAYAEDSDGYFELNLEQLLQVQITGSTLRDESLITAPSAVTVFNRAQLDNLGLDYLYELLSLVPGYQFDRNGDSPAGYTFSARGRRNSSEAREVLLLVDGRIFVDSRTGSADGSLPLFPLSQVERVEVMRGPGSALYGSGAMTGVINIVTRKQRNQVGVAAGSQGRRDLTLLLSSMHSDWEANVFAKIYRDQGQNYRVSNGSSSDLQATDDPVEALDFDGELASQNTKIRLAYHRVSTENFYVAEAVDNSINFYVQSFRHFNIFHSWTPSQKLRSDWSLNYSDVQQNFGFVALPSGGLIDASQPASEDALIIKALLSGKTYQLTSANDWNLTATSSLQFGFDWHENFETQASAHNNFDLEQLATGNFPVRYYGNFNQSTTVGMLAKQRALGVYGQYLSQVSDSTRINLGLRYDDYQNIGAHLSPRLGVVHQLSGAQTIKLLYGEAYRAPSLSELGLINNPVLIGNQNLKHEIVKTLDAIWMLNIFQTSFSLDGFYSRYSSPISTGFLGSTRTYVNGKDESSKGVELEVSKQIDRNWLLAATYSHFFELPDSALREADQLASAVLNYANGSWDVNVSTSYQGARSAIGATGEDVIDGDHWRVNTKIGFKVNAAVELSFQVKNLLDASLRTPAQGIDMFNGIENRGREWKLSIDFKL
jgi:outer membrane receptor protein involved in Fe transport